jgi:hypothetical protein
MNGFIKKAAAQVILGAGFATTVVGCHCYRELVDPCWPERYNAMARHSVRDTFNAQAMNGHILDQTVWDYHFEVDPKNGAGTDKLLPGGMEHLDYLARRRPAPDLQLYLQTSRDPKLDAARVNAVKAYMRKATSGRIVPMEFEVAVHDPSEVGNHARPLGGNQRNPQVKGAVQELHNNYKGKMDEKQGSMGGNSGGGGGGS